MIVVLLLLAGLLNAQSTQGVIAGRVTDRQSGAGLGEAVVHYWGGSITGQVDSDAKGFYALPPLSPGTYRLRAEKSGYQPVEIQEQELRVAARLEIPFAMRPASDVFGSETNHVSVLQSGRMVHFFGPDARDVRLTAVDLEQGRSLSLQATLSQVVDSQALQGLPLAGRDTYTALVFQPGVTSDAGSARGLGLAVNGQRPTASNFLLDGVESNNYLVTGPLVTVAPEAVQEYRVSTNSFSAEYGRTAGYLANPVTRAGGEHWHGLAYYYVKHDALNSDEFKAKQGRLPLKESQPGFVISGRLVPERLYASLAGEFLRFRSQGETQTWILPPANATAVGGLLGFAHPFGRTSIAPPNSINRLLLLPRLDYIWKGGEHRILARMAVSNLDRPNFLWTPYRDFITPLRQTARSFAAAATNAVRPGLTSETRFAWSVDNLRFDRRWPGIPTLTSGDGTILPGSPAAYSFRNRGRSAEAVENLIWAKGRHLVKAGGNVLLRRIDGYLTYGRDGLVAFNDFASFAKGSPDYGLVGVAHDGGPAPDSTGSYGNRQFALFAEDSVRLTNRLGVNLGLRYESFGVPGTAGKPLYDADRNNVAVRGGFGYTLRENTVVRGAYGIFYDRPFDNLWLTARNNTIDLGYAPVVPDNYRNVGAWVGDAFPLGQVRPTRFQPRLRDGYAQNYFFGVQHRPAADWVVEINTTGSLGRKLITTDVLNRLRDPFSYRSNQGLSDYNAFTALVRYRARSLQFQAAYTLSHAIDLQSEPLAGEYFNLDFTAGTADASRIQRAAFQQEGRSRQDRGNADFDQRQNLVGYGVWELPAWLRGWQVSTLAALRSGFPFSVRAPNNSRGNIINQRANLVDPSAVYLDPVPVAGGGVRLLNDKAFGQPKAGEPGNSGRNAFRGPGLVSFDLSLSRSFAMKWLGDAGRLTLRADAFNLLNHANLNPPDACFCGTKSFGVATYGRQGRTTGFLASTPFNETARQVQLLLRLAF